MQPKPKDNIGIFSKPLQPESMRPAKKEIEREWWPWISIATSLVILMIYSSNFLIPEITKIINYSDTLSANQMTIEAEAEKLKALKTLANQYKEDYEKNSTKQQLALGSVLPKDPNKKELINLFETFADRLSKTRSTFEIDKIEFNELVKTKDYYQLPIKISAYASQKNFDRFIALINFSGKTEEENQYVQLMEVNGISVDYRGQDELGKDKGVDFAVELIAYSRI